jgi:hypothetical protein
MRCRSWAIDAVSCWRVRRCSSTSTNRNHTRLSTSPQRTADKTATVTMSSLPSSRPSTAMTTGAMRAAGTTRAKRRVPCIERWRPPATGRRIVVGWRRAAPRRTKESG